jgi:hypothetical protein
MLTPKKYNLLSLFIKDKNTLLFNETLNDNLIIDCKKKNLELKPLIKLCNKLILQHQSNQIIL